LDPDYCFPCKVLESKEGGPRLEEIAAVFGTVVATQGRARSSTMNCCRRLRGQGTRARAAAPRRQRMAGPQHRRNGRLKMGLRSSSWIRGFGLPFLHLPLPGIPSGRAFSPTMATHRSSGWSASCVSTSPHRGSCAVMFLISGKGSWEDVAGVERA
jgi:hypothetical protein